MRNISNIICIILVFAVSVSLVGCGSTNQDQYDNYSYGLTQDGIYENIDAYQCELPDFKALEFSYDDILNWSYETFKENETVDFETIDDYVQYYGDELLKSVGLANKDVVNEGDIVTATLSFSIDGEPLEGYDSSSQYEAVSDGDSIVASFIGKSVNDSYEVEYTFAEDDLYYPSKTAIVSVVIDSIMMQHPIVNGVVDNNLEAVNEYVAGVTDTESFLILLRPQIVEAVVDLYVSDYLEGLEVDVPDEYTEYELYRLKARLENLGYDYESYLEGLKIDDEEVLKECELIAKENYILMTIYRSINYEITDEEMQEYYGDSYEYITSVQGVPYAKLRIIKEAALYHVVDSVTLINNWTDDNNDVDSAVDGDIGLEMPDGAFDEMPDSIEETVGNN